LLFGSVKKVTTTSKLIEQKHYQNWQIYLVEPETGFGTTNPADPDSYVSSGIQYKGQIFWKYATFVDRFPDEYFDLILIDGRARPSCFKHAIPKTKKGGYIVWDNTDRLHYQKTMTIAPVDFKFLDFPGPSPYVSFFTRTSIWHRQT